MKKNLILIIILIILIGFNYYLNYENYYTFFEPLKKKKKKLLNTNKHDYIHDKIIFITFEEYNFYLNKLLIKILKNSNILNIYLYNDLNYKKILTNINSNIYKFCLLPKPLVFSDDYPRLNNLRFIGNISQYDIIFIYNSKINNNMKLNNLNDLNNYLLNNNIEIFTDSINSMDNLLIKNLINNLKIKSKNKLVLTNNNEKDNMNNLLKNKITFYMFIDFQSIKLKNLLKIDYEDKIKMISINNSDLNKLNNENKIYFNKLINFSRYDISINLLNITTLSYTNIIITNKFMNNKLIYFITKTIFENLDKNNNISNISYFHIPLPMLYVHGGATDFFVENGLITYSSNNMCKYYVNNSKCPY
jgi:hypothetical protein